MRDLQIRHRFYQICLTVFRIDIQYFFRVFVRTSPFTFRDEHECSLDQTDLCQIAFFYRHRGRSDLGLGSQDLFDAAQKVLNGADFSHILGLKSCEFLGHVISVDPFVAGDQRLLCALFDQT